MTSAVAELESSPVSDGGLDEIDRIAQSFHRAVCRAAGTNAMNRFCCGVVCLIVIWHPALAQVKPYDATSSNLFLLVASVQSCIESDTLLRRTCARVLATLPAEHRPSCELPAQSFEARTASAFQALKQTYREEMRKIEADLEEAMQRGRASWRKRYGDLIEGKRISMNDLHWLSQEVRSCSRVENALVRPKPRPAN